MIRLQFVLGAGLSSRLIAWYGQGYGGYSHVDAIISNGKLLGARSDNIGGGAGVLARPPDYERWKRRCVVSVKATDKQARDWEKFLLSQLGKPYDKTDILGLIIGKPIMSAGHWICSALQTAALHASGIFPAMPEVPQQVPPNMLLFGVLTAGGKIYA
jgi:hypothetical protein